MAYIKTQDGTNLYYKDWGTGKPIIFVHGWCINCDSWEYIMYPLVNSGYRCIAYDQRGCGRSDQPWNGYDYTSLAADLSTIIVELGLEEPILVGHSMGCGVITQYMNDHGDANVEKAILIGTTTPYALKAADNPAGINMEHINAAINFMQTDRPGYVQSLVDGFFDLPNERNRVSQDMVNWALNIVLQASARASVEMFNTSVKSDQRAILQNISVPVLIMHSDKDVSCPPAITAEPTHALLKNSSLKNYAGNAHGMYIYNAGQIAEDILAFIK